MKSEFDMALFLSPALRGAYATRQRHIRQAERMHEVILERWGCMTPWSWRDKHVRWFLEHYLRCSAPATVYYYELTAGLIRSRRESLKAEHLLNFNKRCTVKARQPCS
ncbi:MULTISPECIES: hypothetical protein [unclassified Pseudomonas]|uniref:hypothetical protein n=1 Tax=unclassified Pseudomonas TaxID=196821 RepID=UPI000C6CC999|nr:MULTISPECIES: hypothetical protein [unclassified Pseudomonas]AUG10025.1 hypothetical protein CXQ82_26950 [Pseudomonas sp. S09G 359]